MLSSIHPLGERAKGNSYRLTVTAHVVGSMTGGLALGALTGMVGVGLAPVWSSAGATALLVAATALAALAEWRGIRLPSWRRQVDENWLQSYRGWVYGAGYGLQLGAAVLTIITSAAVHLFVLAGVLSASIGWASLIGATFGAVRGVSLAVARHVQTSEDLFAFHRRLQARAPSVRRAASVTLGVLAGTLGLTALA